MILSNNYILCLWYPEEYFLCVDKAGSVTGLVLYKNVSITQTKTYKTVVNSVAIYRGECRPIQGNIPP